MRFRENMEWNYDGGWMDEGVEWSGVNAPERKVDVGDALWYGMVW
jgi:hypothetical protein